MCPDGFDVEQCKLHRQRPVWRIEEGRAVLVAYHIYRGPGGELPDVPGLLPRCEFGLEILVTLAFEVVIVGLSMDKTIGQLGFFWNLSLGKSQVDSLQINREASSPGTTARTHRCWHQHGSDWTARHKVTLSN